jgi:hypothetical protein
MFFARATVTAIPETSPSAANARKGEPKHASAAATVKAAAGRRNAFLLKIAT